MSQTWNDDCGTSFRLRDDSCDGNASMRVKYWFKQLIGFYDLGTS